MAIYNEILDQAGGDAKYAGSLHEQIWERLLRQEDPRFHNIRVTNGDGGIDGFVLLDPALGHAAVYQAKFFSDVSSKEHRDAIVDSFISAHKHTFYTRDWILLLPGSFSHQELNWIIGGELKLEAKSRIPQDRHSRVDNCSVTYQLASHLEDLLSKNSDVAIDLLPKSSTALLKRIDDERQRADRTQREIADHLRILVESAIRDRQAETRRTLVAVRTLYQGWADHQGMLESAAMKREPSSQQVEMLAAKLEEFTISRTNLALMTEGVLDGLAKRLNDIYISARLLRQAAVLAQIDTKNEPALKEILAQMVELIQSFQRRMGDAMVLLGRA